VSRTEVSPAGTLVGYAAIFDMPTVRQDQFPGSETIARGAFTAALARADLAVRATVDHSPGTLGLLGTTDAATLKLSQDDRGLRYEITLPDTATARDLRELVGRGDVRGASFMASMDRSTIERTDSGVIHHNFPELIDICVTASPAYAQTSVAARTASRNAARVRDQLIRARARSLGLEAKL
jgi:HK97 family phage prohead protease